MTILKKITAAAAASTLALGLGMAANATSVTVNTVGDVNGNNILNAVDQFQIIHAGIDPLGDLDVDDNTATITVGDQIDTVLLDFGVIQAQPSASDALARGIRNLTLDVMGDMGTMASFTITDADGNLLLTDLGSFAIMAGETLSFVFDGTAFGGPGTRPTYDIGVFGDEALDAVPLPGAAVLFLTAAAGGALRLRKKAA